MTDTPAPRAPFVVKRLTRDELRAFVDDFASDRIFSNRHLPQQQVHLFTSIFSIVGLGGLSDVPAEELEQIGLFYEYMSEAGPMSVNGYPCFMSVKLLHREDWLIVSEAISTEMERRKNIVLPGDL